MQMVKSKEPQKVIELNQDSVVIEPVPPTPTSMGEIMANYLGGVQEGDLMDHAGRLVRDGLIKIIDGDTEKFNLTISLTISKDANDPELFVTKGKAQLKVPIQEFSSAIFIDKNGAPTRNRNQSNKKHTKQPVLL